MSTLPRRLSRSAKTILDWGLYASARLGEAVMGELELALEMTCHTLHRFGVSSLETKAIVQGLRERVEMEDSE